MRSSDKLALNNTQKHIIEVTLFFFLEDICALDKEQKNYHDIQQALISIHDEVPLSPEQEKRFAELDILSSINDIKKILVHDCPQNRTEDYPYFGRPKDPNLIVYKTADDKAAYEKRGLLSLTAKNDSSAPPVTKAAVVTYIKQLVHAELDKTIKLMQENNIPIIAYTPPVSQRKLNSWEKSALRDLSHLGLTRDLLLGLKMGEHKFDTAHWKALVYLVEKRKFPIIVALAEIKGLSSEQADGIKPDSFSDEVGLTRAEVLPVNNYWHIKALKKLKTHGLTREMLLSLKLGEHAFDSQHSEALVYLVQEKKLSIADALAEIEGLSEKHAGGLIPDHFSDEVGLTRAEVLPLNNLWHIQALKKLKTHGLTCDLLLGLKMGEHEFENEHHYALVYLVQERKFSIAAALAEIEGLSSEQADGIKPNSFRKEVGLTRAEVLPLSNFWHIKALKKLKTHGLTRDMLLSLKLGEHEFDSQHHYALEKLVKERNLPIEEALNKIEEQATRPSQHVSLLSLWQGNATGAGSIYEAQRFSLTK